MEVTMDLTPEDIKNANVVEVSTNAVNKAQAVGNALAIVARLMREKDAKIKILIQHKDGKEEELELPISSEKRA